VPASLSKKRVVSLDLSALISGAKYRGEFEERLQGVLKDIQAAGGEIITFIDELHVLLGLGKGEGSVDAGNMLKPSLARGELQCCGATTVNEYRYPLFIMWLTEDNISRRMQHWLEDFNLL
jgi:ATP-dependent Clp protease ATP-binding subunit ClpB